MQPRFRFAARPALLAALTYLLAACAPMHYRVEAGPPDDALLIPPRVHADATDSYVVPYPGVRPQAGCSFDADRIHVEAEPNALIVAMPAMVAAPFSPAVPLQPGVAIAGQQPLARSNDPLAAGLDQLVMAGCLPLRSRLDPLTQVLEAVPLPSDDLSRLSGGNPVGNGYIPLRFGEQLRVTAPLLDAKGQWRGATTLWYGLRLERDGRLALVPPAASAIDVVRGGQRLHAQALDLPPAPVARYWRMIIFGREGDVQQVNVLVAAPDPARLRTATAIVQASNDGGARVAGPAWCSMPKYGTVINVELSVRVQGHWLALRRGADVAAAIRAAEPHAPPGVPKGLRVLRPYGGRLIRVVHAPGSDAILQLTLLGGEQITWHGQ